MPIPTEPIGSIPRPAALIEGMRGLGAGRISAEQWRSLCDQAVRDKIQRFGLPRSVVGHHARHRLRLRRHDRIPRLPGPRRQGLSAARGGLVLRRAAAVYNGGSQASEIVGGYLYGALGYGSLVLISAGTSALAWVLVPWVRIDAIETRARQEVVAVDQSERMG